MQVKHRALWAYVRSFAPLRMTVLVERHRIDDLVVIDDDNMPVGIVDSPGSDAVKIIVGRPLRLPRRGRRSACPTIAKSLAARKLGVPI